MFSRIQTSLLFFALLASLLTLSSCFNTPEDISWTTLHEIPDTDWIKPSYKVIVKNNSGVTNTINYPYDKSTVRDTILMRPVSGFFADILNSTSGPVSNSFSVSFQPDSSHITQLSAQSYLQSHTYFKNKLTNDDSGYSAWNNIFTYVINQESPALKAGDSWYVIYVFRGTNGELYKFTTPAMKVDNAP